MCRSCTNVSMVDIIARQNNGITNTISSGIGSLDNLVINALNIKPV